MNRTRLLAAIALSIVTLGRTAVSQPIMPPGGLPVMGDLVTHVEGAIDHLGIEHAHPAFDKCGPIDEEKAAAAYRALSADEDYMYADLLADLEVWRQSPHVQAITSIGKTVEGRDIWELTITADAPGEERRHRIAIHARTHPHEIQSWWVAEQLIRYLLSDDPFFARLRETCTFHIIPMYNPDGVEARSTRYNANGIDLEREWDKPNPQPEAAALKARYKGWMMSDRPIEVMLNLHSASDPQRYFWYHDVTGTSPAYAALEQEFINNTRAWFPQISPWNYRVSWIDDTPTHFPESWFWFNYGKRVMALTYEEIFAHTPEHPEGKFDSAAFALLHGIYDYLEIQATGVAVAGESASATLTVVGSEEPHLSLRLTRSAYVALRLYDPLGRTIANVADERLGAGHHRFAVDAAAMASGVYFVEAVIGEGEERERVVVKMIVP